jgi:dTDP-4-amino-4,6-dideoxygalactose transaminase
VTRLPALLGGSAAFSPSLAFVRPTVEEPEAIAATVQKVLESGHLTDGPHARELEERIAQAVGVAHCVAVSSCTIGLMLVVQALDLQGPAVVPSFTFSATAHALHWNRVPILFADCDPATWCLRPSDVYDDPELIVGVHVSGVPCDVEGLARIAAERGAVLVFDAAHGAGSLVHTRQGIRPLGGFGLAEVFSLTPTKVLSSAEGGLITTDDEALADRLRVARNYGNPGDYHTRFPGLNARLSELHAAVALSSLEHLEERVEQRNEVATRYRRTLSEVPGVGFQEVPAGTRSSYKDFTILVDGERFGCPRDGVVVALRAEGVETRPYYSPPVHRQPAYEAVPSPPLPVTERLSSQVISLPIWSHMPMETVDRVCEALTAIQANAERIGELISSQRGMEGRPG